MSHYNAIHCNVCLCLSVLVDMIVSSLYVFPKTPNHEMKPSKWRSLEQFLNGMKSMCDGRLRGGALRGEWSWDNLQKYKYNKYKNHIRHIQIQIQQMRGGALRGEWFYWVANVCVSLIVADWLLLGGNITKEQSRIESNIVPAILHKLSDVMFVTSSCDIGAC